MNFRFFYIILYLVLTFSQYAFSQRDNLSIDPRWSVWTPRKMSNDGNWLWADKQYASSKQKDQSFFVNIQTGKQVVFDFDSSKILLDQNRFLLLQGPKWEWELVDLLNPDQRTPLKDVQAIELASQLKRYVCFTTNNELHVYDYTQKVPQIVWSTTAVTHFQVNASKTTILYRKEEENAELYMLDLKTLQENQLEEKLEEMPIFYWTWNRDETAAAIVNNQHILYVNLKTSKYKVIEFPSAEEARTNISFKFFDNNDLYIQYQISSGIVNKEKDLVDVWNGNARDLHLKNSWWLYYDTTRNDPLKAFIYSQEKEQLVALERNRNKEYFHIGVPNYILSYDPFEKDHNMETPALGFINRYVLEQIQPHKVLGELTSTNQLDYFLNRSPKGTAMVYPKGALEDYWELYDFETHQRTTIPQKHDNNHVLWSSDSKSLFFYDGQNAVQYDIEKKTIKSLTDLKEPTTSITFQGYINTPQPSYLNIDNPITLYIRYQDFGSSLYSFYKNKLIKIVEHTNKRINLNGTQGEGEISHLFWTEEYFDQPPTVKAMINGKVKTILNPDVPKQLYAWRKQKFISFTDKYGKKLNGILFYPKDFDASKKYPMVTYIYDENESAARRNTFDMISLKNPFGFNIPLLNSQGYFVFICDTYVSEEGPGLSAVECITNGVTAITTEEPAINSNKLGIIGQSFSGYKTAFIVSQTNLFAAAVSGAGAHDLINFYYEYNYERNALGWLMFEKSQYGIKSSFGENPEKYLYNSTMNYAHQIKTPLLLYTGLEDKNVIWEHTRHLYVALKRYQIPTVAFFYKKEGHSLFGVEAQEHFTYKTMDWFDYYLKDNKNISWITKGVDYNTYSY